MMMLSNSCGVTRRPGAETVYVNSWSFGDGGGARVCGRDADRRRREERVLLDRQARQREQAHDHHDDRDDDRDDRTADEKLCHDSSG
jgi:hypothetical protein